MNKEHIDLIIEKSKNIKQTSDFEYWTNEDLSELFWQTIGEYTKEPTEQRSNLLYMLFQWACHIDHGLANCFAHALKWCKIDWWE